MWRCANRLPIVSYFDIKCMIELTEGEVPGVHMLACSP